MEDKLQESINLIMEGLQKFVVAGTEIICETLRGVFDGLGKLRWIPYPWDLIEDEELRNKALDLGVSRRIVMLSRRPGKTGKKNMTRLKKEVKRRGTWL